MDPFTIMLISSAISSGVGYLASSKAASASTEAARIQTAASEKAATLQAAAAADALDFQKQQWQETLAMAKPYSEAGAGAVNKLSYLLGVTPMPMSSGGTSTGTSGTSTTKTGTSGTYSPQTGRLRQLLQNDNYDMAAMPTPITSDQVNQVRAMQGTAQGSPDVYADYRDAIRGPQRAYGKTSGLDRAGMSGKTIRMKSPDGGEYDVPEEYRRYYENMGAEVVEAEA